MIQENFLKMAMQYMRLYNVDKIALVTGLIYASTIFFTEHAGLIKQEHCTVKWHKLYILIKSMVYISMYGTVKVNCKSRSLLSTV